MVAQTTGVVKTTSVENIGTPHISLKALAADWARKHGLTLDTLKRWQWMPVVYLNRPALRFETLTGPRYRFLDKLEPRFMHKRGYERCWYGLTPELVASVDDDSPLIICNGEGSTMAAQTNLLLATCITSGEKSRMPDNLLDELKQKLAPGAAILIAFDCDATGRRAASGMAAQLNEAGFKARAVDMGLSDGGDLADFCMMHGAAAYEHLMACPDLPQIDTPMHMEYTHAHGTPMQRQNPHANKPADVSPEFEAKRENWFKKAWDGIVRTVETTTSGRYNVVWWGARKLLDLVHEGYRSESEARTAIENACEANGYRADHGNRAVMAQWQGAVKATRESVDIPDFSEMRRAERLGKDSAKGRQDSSTKVRQKYGKSTAEFSPVLAEGLTKDSPKTRQEVPQKYPKSTSEKGAKSDDLEQVFAPYNVRYTTLPILEASDGRPEQLPDAIIKHGLDVWGLRIVSEVNYLLGAMASGKLPSVFTLEDRNASSETPANKNVYTEMVQLGILQKVSSELIPDLTLYLSSESRVKTGINPGGRKPRAYQLASPDELKRLMFQPLAASRLSMQPETLSLIDAGLMPLVQHTLERLLLWKTPLKSVHIGLVQGSLKAADKYRAAEVYEAIQALPITDAELVAYMGLEDAADSIVALGAQMDQDMRLLIGLKNRLLLRLYETHIDALDNPHTTPLPDTAPRTGQAWLSTHYNALIQPHSGGYLYAYELNGLMGIDDKNTAKRAAEAAGIVSLPRYETRAFTVPLIEGTPTWEAVKQTAKQTAKNTDKALEGRIMRGGVIRSYDEKGRLIGQAEYSESDHPQGFNIGVRFTIELQLRNLITVSDIAPLADETPEKSAADPADETPEQEAATGPTKARVSRRITPARLHDRTWLLERLLAPFCKLSTATEAGHEWVNPLTGELHMCAQDVLNDIKAHLLAQDAQGVTA